MGVCNFRNTKHTGFSTVKYPGRLLQVLRISFTDKSDTHPQISSDVEIIFFKILIYSKHLEQAIAGEYFCAIRRKTGSTLVPVLTAAPTRGLVDEQIGIKADFLPPRHPVTLCAQMRSEDGDLWEAFGHYNTSADGTVEVTRDHSVGGSYLGCEPMGLFWAMQPAPGEREGLRLRMRNVKIPLIVNISLSEGHVSPREPESGRLAVATAERWFTAPGVQRIDVRQNGVVGTLFLPPGPGSFPAVLDLWGMGGGLVEYRSSMLASRGFASFSVAYMEHKDLTVQLDISGADAYMKKAFHILQDHPQICGDRIGIIGLSYGVYLGLRMATSPDLNPSCLVCINGPAGSNKELSQVFCKPKTSESDQRYWPRDEAGYLSFRDMSLPANYSPGTQVKIENLACPTMYILGEDDQNSPSTENSNLVKARLDPADWRGSPFVPPELEFLTLNFSAFQIKCLTFKLGWRRSTSRDLSAHWKESKLRFSALQIEDVLKAAGKSHLYTRLSYPGAGHLIEVPYTPHARLSVWRIKPEKILSLWGGETAPHAAAQEDSWKKMLHFLDTNLRA
ncbi:bile acid-CoA:amino acid N-acyltransferase-like isoform X1 [Corythoichthys intestinalis]|uniref:bile acid-CoA:amino acid N-acyltransferase-like isoform X1 n=1 Tax=Corythoichthys intestinalis TaxID=161448 RepID=UPI0025A585AB|nr:bile acid-CoA:amino acid N-acyltransferase-like isoform X1 [Corythoichthys intestinalis]